MHRGFVMKCFPLSVRASTKPLHVWRRERPTHRHNRESLKQVLVWFRQSFGQVARRINLQLWSSTISKVRRLPGQFWWRFVISTWKSRLLQSTSWKVIKWSRNSSKWTRTIKFQCWLTATLCWPSLGRFKLTWWTQKSREARCTRATLNHAQSLTSGCTLMSPRSFLLSKNAS